VTDSIRVSGLTLLRLLGGPVILAAVLVWVDVPEVLSRLGNLHPAWVALALGVGVVQTLGSAWRWRFTAGRLDIRLPFGAAVREYWLAGFLNQVIPGGVVGDVSRAFRHARNPQERDHDPPGADGHPPVDWSSVGGGFESRAVHAVILERLSGQVVVAVAAAVSGVALLTPLSGGWATAWGLAVLVGIVVVQAAVPSDSSRHRPGEPVSGFSDSLRAALVGRTALPVQLVTSVGVVASYVAMYLAAARAVGVETPFVAMLPLVTPVLLAMLVPVSVAGWGVREGAAAAIWASAGLPASDGVAISVAYGALVLVSTLPGALVLVADGLTRRRSGAHSSRSDRGRTGGRHRVGGASRGVAEHPTERRPGEG